MLILVQYWYMLSILPAAPLVLSIEIHCSCIVYTGKKNQHSQFPISALLFWYSSFLFLYIKLGHKPRDCMPQWEQRLANQQMSIWSGKSACNSDSIMGQNILLFFNFMLLIKSHDMPRNQGIYEITTLGLRYNNFTS